MMAGTDSVATFVHRIYIYICVHAFRRPTVCLYSDILFSLPFSLLQDDFNLTGLSTMVPHYDYALDMVLDVEMPMEDSLTEEQQEIVESAAEMLYGLIHARYVILLWLWSSGIYSSHLILSASFLSIQVYCYQPRHARHVRKVPVGALWPLSARILSGTAGPAGRLVRPAPQLYRQCLLSALPRSLLSQIDPASEY